MSRGDLSTCSAAWAVTLEAPPLQKPTTPFDQLESNSLGVDLPENIEDCFLEVMVEAVLSSVCLSSLPWSLRESGHAQTLQRAKCSHFPPCPSNEESHWFCG